MKKLIIIIILSITLVISSFSAVKIDKIAVINLEEIITTVFSGKSAAIQEIKKDKEDLQKNLDKMKENIMKLQEAKLKTNDSNTKVSYEKKIEALEKEYADYYKLQSYNIQKKQKNALGSVLNEIREVIRKIAENEGYTLVLNVDTDGIIYYSVDIDITEKVKDYFNGTYGEDKVQ